MNKIEEILKKRKKELDNIEIPEELEMKLHDALKDKKISSTRHRKWKMKAAALFLIVIFMGYNINTLALYGKKLVGYDEIMNETLKELNELQKGQSIDKSYTFKNGVTITLDGIMIDDNQLLAYYTIKDPNGKINDANSNLTIDMIGTKGNYSMESSQGLTSNEKTEAKYIASFAPPSFYEKKLKMNITLTEGNKRETGEITFKLDRNKAMGYSLKKDINKDIKIDEGKIRFDSITASPTATVIKGRLQNTLGLVLDHVNKKRFKPEQLDVRLIANGKELLNLSSEISTNIGGIKFKQEYDALPDNLESLQIYIISFSADHDVYKQIKLARNNKVKSIKILDNKIDINKVYESKGKTYVTITTEENVVLSKVHLLIDDKKVKLENTISNKHDKKENGVTTHTRTLCFKGTGKSLKLDIKRLKYNKNYNQIIDIPVK
ncbi:hypothetical protein CLPU_8c01050 [Gottschalkia purinilytica]|uniref:DUF4179 domain-containing protein n=1 Tax=Gottschalkia purinilytica TaxID=1503 RepID=A0A0L0WAJ2_GOTPU|nr:DUF4179 domain-containing protein [Gottschalkia purinilytica]KNF08340.1 hypothetical protein CLPU_8c01050 [Gottschalkia purinilytica]